MLDKLVQLSLHFIFFLCPHTQFSGSANSSFSNSPALPSMELLGESSNISPRISFSHDLVSYDVVRVEQRHVRSDSSSLGSAFEFSLCSHENFDHESSSADELFSEGKILPTPIKKKKAVSKTEEKQSDSETEEKQSRDTKLSFWRLKRSSSLGCGRGYGRRLCPLPLLSRSYSTGSTKQAPLSKESHHYQKQSHSSSSKQLQPPTNGSYRKPPLRKQNGVSSPALNVHSGNLFGLGSIIFNGKDKNKRK